MKIIICILIEKRCNCYRCVFRQLILLFLYNRCPRIDYWTNTTNCYENQITWIYVEKNQTLSKYSVCFSVGFLLTLMDGIHYMITIVHILYFIYLLFTGCVVQFIWSHFVCAEWRMSQWTNFRWKISCVGVVSTEGRLTFELNSISPEDHQLDGRTKLGILCCSLIRLDWNPCKIR